jgi:cytochrome P450
MTGSISSCPHFRRSYKTCHVPVSYDPLSDEFRRDREGVYRRLRDEAPVHLDPDRGVALLSRFEDVRAATLDWQTFSAVTAEAKILRPIINDMDPPLHGQRRANLSRAFTPRRVAAMEPRLREIARSLVDQFAGRGSCDVVAEFAAAFPSRVIGELIGIPEELLEECRAITDAVMRLEGPEGNVSPVERADALFGELIAQRRAAPRDDLISALLAVGRDGGEPLSEEEILGFCYLLLVGGSDTTTNLIGNGMELLARHPDQRAQLVDDPSLLPQAIEELLRREPPTQISPRQTTRDVRLHDVVIPADTRVLLGWGAANLDEREFDDPETFDIHRDPGRHLALGHGAHFCMGAALARLEARVAFEELLACMPTFEVVEEPERIHSGWAWGFESLRLEFPAVDR